MNLVAITGGLGDIGLGIAQRFATDGYRVVLGDLASEAPEGLPFDYFPVDVADPKSVERWFAWIESEIGVPTVVVPNAARVTLAHADGIAFEDWNAELAVNLTGAFWTARVAANAWRGQELGGRIIFVGSWVAERTDPAIVAYSVSKSALRALMRAMALDLAPFGITVNEVAPGYVDAGLTASIFRRDPARREGCRSRTPTERLIESSEVANAVAWLASEGAKNVTGSVVTLDGGLRLLGTG